MSGTFLISVSSDFRDLWRYNIAVVCQCLDAEGEQIEVCSKSSYIAEVGANLTESPAGLKSHGRVVLSTPPCDKIEALCYLIPHSLPTNKIVEESMPFDLRITIEKEGQMLYDTTHKVNQWAGASISLKA